jgi:hypothetical protein
LGFPLVSTLSLLLLHHMEEDEKAESRERELRLLPVAERKVVEMMRSKYLLKCISLAS